ncbi:hypothetical protein AB6A40_011178 [Gnathostoma spinigerum]|uniref:Vacuolar protein sorting-associated protein 54 C-terminal domain-containing protein n=1 Tax=Gnathostoma spinigerum TaxID=75299 RepID=A0ABD6F2Y0_9BILA
MVLSRLNEFSQECLLLTGQGIHWSSQLHVCLMQQTLSFVKKFHDDRKALLGRTLDSESWRQAEIPSSFQTVCTERLSSLRLSDFQPVNITVCQRRNVLIVDQEPFVVNGTVLLLVRMLAEYCEALMLFSDFAPELLMCVVELLKNYNSRSCQLILGAGALQLIGLKSISVRHLALSSRCLQLVLLFMPVLKSAFEERMPEGKRHLLRHIDQVSKDYRDHIQEITNKLVNVIDHCIVVQLRNWEVKGTVPSLAFSQICRQLSKFHNGIAGIMPDLMVKDLFVRVHENFKVNLKDQLGVMGVTPHDSLTYGFVSQEYLYYIKSLQSMSCCSSFKTESISDALYGKR